MKQKILFSALVILLPLTAQADLEFTPFPLMTIPTESASDVVDLATTVIKPVDPLITIASPIVTSGEIQLVIQQKISAKLKGISSK